LPHPQANSVIRTKSTHNSQKSKPIQTPNVPLHQTKNINQKSNIMATIKKGILGGFSGKVGNVVGANWKTISYMRSHAQKVKNPRTPKQIAHRQKFKLMFDYLKPITPFLKVGFQLYAQKQTPHNAALSYNMKNAVFGTSPNWWLNKHRILVTRGNLTPIKRVFFHRNGQHIFLNWGDNTGVGNSKPDDNSLIIVYNTTKGEYLSTINGPERNYRMAGFRIPDSWKDCWFDVHFAFISADRKQVSNSVFVGSMQFV
jgi:hypothetical protein